MHGATHLIRFHYYNIHVRLLSPWLPADHPEYAHTCTGSEAHGRTLKTKRETIISPTSQSGKLPHDPHPLGGPEGSRFTMRQLVCGHLFGNTVYKPLQALDKLKCWIPQRTTPPFQSISE